MLSVCSFKSDSLEALSVTDFPVFFIDAKSAYLLQIGRKLATVLRIPFHSQDKQIRYTTHVALHVVQSKSICLHS